MLDIDSLSYVKVADSNVPGLVSGSVVQTGALTLSTNTGIGALVVEPGKAADELL